MRCYFNEFLKAHQTIENQPKEIAALKLALKEQGAKIEQISAQVQASPVHSGW